MLAWCFVACLLLLWGCCRTCRGLVASHIQTPLGTIDASDLCCLMHNTLVLFCLVVLKVVLQVIMVCCEARAWGGGSNLLAASRVATP
jgi:hypothetical protein